MGYRIKQATGIGYIDCCDDGLADLSYPESKTRRGRVQGGGTISPTITTQKSEICKMEKHYRIRKLTPLECWRLMGFSDEDFAAAKLGDMKVAKAILEKHPTTSQSLRFFKESEKLSAMSNTQLYKQAGNSIVKTVLMAIFSQLGIEGVKKWNDMTEDEIYEMIDKVTRTHKEPQ